MTAFEALAKSDEEPGALGRHALLLASLVGLMVALPLFRSVPGGGLRFSILLCLVLTAAVYVSSQHRWSLVAAILLGGGAISAVAVGETTDSMAWHMASRSMGLGLLGFTIFLMLNSLMRAERVSKDTIIGGICVYLMIGLSFTLAYVLAIDLEPSALLQGGLPIAESLTDSSARSAKILYFSFVTLTTLGYGDITPSGELAQMLVTGEAIIGQLYIAIFIARLMALYLAGDRARLTNELSRRDE